MIEKKKNRICSNYLKILKYYFIYDKTFRINK